MGDYLDKSLVDLMADLWVVKMVEQMACFGVVLWVAKMVGMLEK